ncbi:MAG: solute carrier family 23 protein [Mycobacterium sp.]
MRLSWKPVDSRSDPDFVVAPDERLSWPRTLGLGAQHVVAMFGATFLVPVLTGFPPATTLLFSGVGTILFLLITGNRLPSYLGSSFSVIAPVTAAVAAQGTGSALGGIVAVGLLLILVGAVVHLAVIALIAENIGHVKSVGQMTRTDMDPLMGRALAADGVATTLAGFGGGSATTTYAENIGVMAATRVYSTAAYWVAAAVAIVLSLCPKVGAVISAVPAGVLGGATIVLYGLVGILGVRIWLTNHVDFSKPVNQMTAAIPLVIGIADFTWQAGNLTFTGIALGSIAALLVYHGMRLLGFRPGARTPADGADPAAAPR